MSSLPVTVSTISSISHPSLSERSSQVPCLKRNNYILSDSEHKDSLILDAAVDRIVRALPSNPYVLTVPTNLPVFKADYREIELACMDSPFEPHEYHLQYVSNIMRENASSLFILKTIADEEREKLLPSTSSVTSASSSSSTSSSSSFSTSTPVIPNTSNLPSQSTDNLYAEKSSFTSSTAITAAAATTTTTATSSPVSSVRKVAKSKISFKEYANFKRTGKLGSFPGKQKPSLSDVKISPGNSPSLSNVTKSNSKPVATDSRESTSAKLSSPLVHTKDTPDHRSSPQKGQSSKGSNSPSGHTVCRVEEDYPSSSAVKVLLSETVDSQASSNLSGDSLSMNARKAGVHTAGLNGSGKNTSTSLEVTSYNSVETEEVGSAVLPPMLSPTLPELKPAVYSGGGFELPRLLSPTLPPQIEAQLTELQKAECENGNSSAARSSVKSNAKTNYVKRESPSATTNSNVLIAKVSSNAGKDESNETSIPAGGKNNTHYESVGSTFNGASSPATIPPNTLSSNNSLKDEVTGVRSPSNQKTKAMGSTGPSKSLSYRSSIKTEEESTGKGTGTEANGISASRTRVVKRRSLIVRLDISGVQNRVQQILASTTWAAAGPGTTAKGARNERGWINGGKGLGNVNVNLNNMNQTRSKRPALGAGERSEEHTESWLAGRKKMKVQDSGNGSVNCRITETGTGDGTIGDARAGNNSVALGKLGGRETSFKGVTSSISGSKNCGGGKGRKASSGSCTSQRTLTPCEEVRNGGSGVTAGLTTTFSRESMHWNVLASIYLTLGRNLKHEAGALLLRAEKEMREDVAEEEFSRTLMLSIESVMAFMLAFYVADYRRRLSGKASRIDSGWVTLLPFWREVHGRIQKSVVHGFGKRQTFNVKHRHLLGLHYLLGVSICSYIGAVIEQEHFEVTSGTLHRKKGNGDEGSVDERFLLELMVNLTNWQSEAVQLLSVEELMTEYPKTWSGRSTDARPIGLQAWFAQDGLSLRINEDGGNGLTSDGKNRSEYGIREGEGEDEDYDKSGIEKKSNGAQLNSGINKRNSERGSAGDHDDIKTSGVILTDASGNDEVNKAMADLKGRYWCPVDAGRSPLDTVRFGVEFLREWRRAEGIVGRGRLGW